MNQIARPSILCGLLFVAVGCSAAASANVAPSSQALDGTARAVIARASATTPHGRLVASPALGFGDSGAPASETALCFAGAVDAVCARIATDASDGAKVDECVVAGDAVAVQYAVSGGPIVSRTMTRCTATAGSADLAPTGTFVVASSARRDASGDVVASVALGFSVDPNAAGPVSFCYAGASADVCRLVKAYTDGASIKLQDCSVDGATVTASYTVDDTAGSAVLTPCGR